MILIVMGVSGCGKSTVGLHLAEQLTLPFYDADDFHPAANISKMSQGIPLTDEDRLPWLNLLAEHIKDWELEGGAVLACSALKQSYRDILSATPDDVVRFVYLKGDQTLLASRLRNRGGHFMPEALLESQFDALEPPTDAITVLLENTVQDIVSEIIQVIKK